MPQRAVLLVNLGSPDSPAVGDVRAFLREFLMDGRVLDVPWLFRFILVNFLIAPRRAPRSAEAYRQIWGPEGSPLVAAGKKVQAALRQRLAVPIELAMRYRQPSVEQAVQALAAQQARQWLLVPLYPHYAMSTFETTVEHVKTVLARQAPHVALQIRAPYFDEPSYITALTACAAPAMQGAYDHLLFSFHGLPERHLRKSDPTGAHCLQVPDCCHTPHPAHATCYRAQCLKTVAAFAQKAGLPPGKYSVAFQSRLGRQPWLKPYTDQELERLAGAGVKKLLVICPSFVADCLETLEEIGLRGRAIFRQAGGEELTLVPCLNDHPRWVDALAGWVETWSNQDIP